MPSIGLPELIIVLVIIVIIFGVGRLTGVGGALGKGIRDFRNSLAGQADDEKTDPPPGTGGRRGKRKG